MGCELVLTNARQSYAEWDIFSTGLYHPMFRTVWGATGVFYYSLPS